MMDILLGAAVSSHPRALFLGFSCPQVSSSGHKFDRGHAGAPLPWSDFHSSLNGRRLQSVEEQQQRNSRQRLRRREECVFAKSMKAEADEVQVDDKDKQSGSFLTFLCPLLKVFGGGDPAAPRNVFLETATSGLASLARLPWGSRVNAEISAERTNSGCPPQLIQLYEFEACPFCRRVREALTELDLSAEIYPCPKGSSKHREFVKKSGGQEQFPYLIDPNTGLSMYESSEIVNYLFKQYGGGRKPSPGLLESTLVTGWMPTLLRAGRGMMLYPKASSDTPAQKLELYNYENNQGTIDWLPVSKDEEDLIFFVAKAIKNVPVEIKTFARLVREALCELELPYILRNVGKGSTLRDSLLKLAGSTQVPYLVDPNTGRSIGESQDIISYLFTTYGTKN